MRIPRSLVVMFALMAVGASIAICPTPSAGNPAPSGGAYAPVGWSFEPAHPCSSDAVRLRVFACPPCATIISAEVVDGHHVVVEVRQHALDHSIWPPPCNSGVACDSTGGFVLEIGTFSPGEQTVDINVRTLVTFSDSTNIGEDAHRFATFVVGRSCGPPRDALPYVREVVIGPPPICSTDSIRVQLSGTFPNSCYRLSAIQLFPSPEANPLPRPPIVHLIVDTSGCQTTCLTPFVQPWHAVVMLPPLPPGAYGLGVEVAQVSCQDSLDGGPLPRRLFAFSVADNCPPPHECLTVDWSGFSGSRIGCTSVLDVTRRTAVTLHVAPSVALSGLQGSINVFPPGLQIVAINAVGVASDMRVQWNARQDGAEFVMFAKSGAPIPSHGPPGTTPGDSVLRITLVMPDSVAAPPVSYVTANSLLGADENGGAVPPCQIATLVVVAARVCAGPTVSCDFNHDGATDVRDLVLMVHCILGHACADSTAAYDCNSDGERNIDDVLCCAHTILHGDMPDSTLHRDEPAVRVCLGTPIANGSGFDVPVTLTDENLVGAARLDLAYPADRFEMSCTLDAQDSPNWLLLQEAGSDRLTLGLIGLGARPHIPEANFDVHATLHLTLRAGQLAGGAVEVASAQFAGPDGAALRVPLDRSTQTLGGVNRIALASPRPNPFTRETRFTISLPKAAAVELTVHDLSGRRLATVFRGPLAPGVTEFTWRGRGDNGDAAPNGVYFVRLSVDGETVARKVALLRGN